MPEAQSRGMRLRYEKNRPPSWGDRAARRSSVNGLERRGRGNGAEFETPLTQNAELPVIQRKWSLLFSLWDGSFSVQPARFGALLLGLVLPLLKLHVRVPEPH